MQRLPHLLALISLLTACAAPPAAAPPPTVIAFPTVTPGRQIVGFLPTLDAAAGGESRLNPATAVALANLPTATPDYAACPAPAAPPLPTLPMPLTGLDIVNAITAYLSAGASPTALEAALNGEWALFSSGGVRADVDLIGAGRPQVIVSYRAPDDGGTLLVVGCFSGLYVPLFQNSTGGDAPLISGLGDMTADGRPEILLNARICAETGQCAYRPQIITWDAATGRLINLLDGLVSSDEPAATSDVDNDRVLELIVRQRNTGTRETGPLRTGVTIYDWNGARYVPSIVQFDPPRYRIQVIHEADRALKRGDAALAVSLYERARADTALQTWLQDEVAILDTYIFYRLLILYAYTDQANAAVRIYQESVERYPENTLAPVYILLMDAFWLPWQQTNNLRTACADVLEIVVTRPEAVGFLNRYGSRGPVYTEQDICPF